MCLCAKKNEILNKLPIILIVSRQGVRAKTKSDTHKLRLILPRVVVGNTAAMSVSSSWCFVHRMNGRCAVWWVVVRSFYRSGAMWNRFCSLRMSLAVVLMPASLWVCETVCLVVARRISNKLINIVTKLMGKLEKVNGDLWQSGETSESRLGTLECRTWDRKYSDLCVLAFFCYNQNGLSYGSNYNFEYLRKLSGGKRKT